MREPADWSYVIVERRTEWNAPKIHGYYDSIGEAKRAVGRIAGQEPTWHEEEDQVRGVTPDATFEVVTRSEAETGGEDWKDEYRE